MWHLFLPHLCDAYGETRSDTERGRIKRKRSAQSWIEASDLPHRALRVRPAYEERLRACACPGAQRLFPARTPHLRDGPRHRCAPRRSCWNGKGGSGAGRGVALGLSASSGMGR